MLRRNPTTITLTQADLELYEANRQRKLWEKQQQQASSQSTESSEKAHEKEQAAKSKKDRVLGDRRN
jgi:sensor domain CHASE-containing protein